MLVVTITGGDAAPPRFPAAMVRATVTVPEMVAVMMDMRAVSRVWCVGPTTARSLVCTTMRRMTAVTCPVQFSQPPSPTHSDSEVFL